MNALEQHLRPPTKRVDQSGKPLEQIAPSAKGTGNGADNMTVDKSNPPTLKSTGIGAAELTDQKRDKATTMGFRRAATCPGALPKPEEIDAAKLEQRMAQQMKGLGTRRGSAASGSRDELREDVAEGCHCR